MLRRTPLKRGSKPLRRTRLKPISDRRRRQRAEYRDEHAEHLRLHPFCQLKIAQCGFKEADVLAHAAGLNADNCRGIFYQGQLIPIATEVHHRNKCDGARLTDRRWFASASRQMHDWVENNKKQARAEGYLLPLEADKDGRLPDGTVCLTTDEWLTERNRLAMP